MISSAYIKIDALRNAAAQYENLFSYLINKQTLKFHDEKGHVYNRAEVPHFALTSDVQYWSKFDTGTMANWWDVLHILVAYMLYNMQTAAIWDTNTADNIVAAIQQYANWPRSSIVITLNALVGHQKEIPYGGYLVNPAGLFGSSGNSNNGNYQPDASGNQDPSDPNYQSDQGGGTIDNNMTNLANNQQQQGGGNNKLLLIGGAVLAFLLLSKKKGKR